MKLTPAALRPLTRLALAVAAAVSLSSCYYYDYCPPAPVVGGYCPPPAPAYCPPVAPAYCPPPVVVAPQVCSPWHGTWAGGWGGVGVGPGWGGVRGGWGRGCW